MSSARNDLPQPESPDDIVSATQAELVDRARLLR
jgi:hypothetical protein